MAANEITLGVSQPINLNDFYSSTQATLSGRRVFGDTKRPFAPIGEILAGGFRTSTSFVYGSTANDPCSPDLSTRTTSSSDPNELSQYPFSSQAPLRWGSVSALGGVRAHAGLWSGDLMIGPGLTSISLGQGDMYSNLWSDPNDCGKGKIGETDPENWARVFSGDVKLQLERGFPLGQSDTNFIVGGGLTFSSRWLLHSPFPDHPAYHIGPLFSADLFTGFRF